MFLTSVKTQIHYLMFACSLNIVIKHHCAQIASQNGSDVIETAKSVVKTLDENIIDVKPFTDSYNDCRGHCADTEGCSWFTFFNHDDEILSNHCFLLSEEGGTNPGEGERCENCVSGPVECQPSDCTMDIGDGKAAAITEVNKHHTVTITAGPGVCTLTLLVVGGGGSGNDCQSGYSTCGDGGGGGGSGYIKYMSMTLGQGVHKISAFVGNSGISSNECYGER